MKYIKYLISIVLFITVLIQPFVLVSNIEKVVYIGIIVPAIFQRMWFGNWIHYKNDKTFWTNVLFSVIFIISSILVLDMLIFIGPLFSNSNYMYTDDLLTFVLFVFNRALFFFAIIYVWNKHLLERRNKILHIVFNILQFFYGLIAILVAIWLLWMLIINILTLL